ncbi:MAG TPA: LytTR family DNA-binding domain-containing protein [Puia sp.]|nr:LytTR family DNA-binding domain-containing protein [Puia sp.]
MTDIRCLIVDDEPLAIDIVVTYLDQLGIHTVATANNAIAAFQRLQQDPVDLLFLDIQMPQLTGFDLLKSLQHRPLVVITTAYRDYAVEGFEWAVLDYLVKPFSFTRFLQTIEKATRTLQTAPVPLEEENGLIFLKTDRHLIRIDIESILYIESLKDYIRVYTTTGNYLSHQSLTDITARLPADRFYRVHRSYTLAIDKIDQIRQHCARIGAAIIPISRAHRRDLYHRLGK